MRPCASVLALTWDRVPLPAVILKVTDTPSRPRLARSRTSTSSGMGSCCPPHRYIPCRRGYEHDRGIGRHQRHWFKRVLSNGDVDVGRKTCEKAPLWRVVHRPGRYSVQVGVGEDEVARGVGDCETASLVP